jgi:DNA polymerase-3 subunit delta'
MPRFADIRGQDEAHALLRLAVARERLPHAVLFHGTRGIGKTSTAFALAQFLNCAAPTETDSCGVCASCRKIDRLHHPDVHWIFPMAGSLKGEQRGAHIRATIEARLEPGIHALTYKESASIAIGRDQDLRTGSVGEVRFQAGITPVEAQVKVFVVSDAERMTAEAANSLLKVLEEPPPHNLIVLTAQRPSALLKTIVSRCQSVRFRDLREDEVAEMLMERVRIPVLVPKGEPPVPPAPPSLAHAALAAALSRGSAANAAALLDEETDVVSLRDRAVAFLAFPPGDPRLHDAVDAIAAMGDRSAVARFLDFGALWLGDLLRIATGSEVPIANRDREDAVRREAVGMTVTEIRRRARLLDEARRAMEGNVYMRLVLYGLIEGLHRAEGAPRREALTR